MKKSLFKITAIASVTLLSMLGERGANGAVLINYERVANSTTAPSFSTPSVTAPGAWSFVTLPKPSATDNAQGKTVTLAAGSGYGSPSGPLSVLTDGKVTVGQANFGNDFVMADATNSRLVLDLGSATAVTRISAFAWESDIRGALTFKLYGAAAPSNANPSFTAAGFQNDSAMSSLGYTAIGTSADPLVTGGQHTVSFTDSVFTIGTYRYLAFDFTNSVFGRSIAEIDVVTVPEPTSIAALCLGGMMMLRRWR